MSAGDFSSMGQLSINRLKWLVSYNQIGRCIFAPDCGAVPSVMKTLHFVSPR